MFAGIDLGASSLKLTLCDESGQVVASKSSPLTTIHPAPGWAEQHPGDWQQALQQAFAGLNKDCQQRLRALSICAGTHSFVLLNARGEPLGRAVLWSDQRAGAIAARLAQEHGTTITKLGKNRIRATWTLAMLAWFKQHLPEHLAPTHRLCFAKDYLREWLCGRLAARNHCTDLGDAVGSLLVELKCEQWSPVLCQLGGIRPQQLPRITSAPHLAGTLDDQFATQLGLPRNLPIYTGCIDTSAELLPAGALAPDDTLLKFASAGVWSRVAEKPSVHPQASLYPTVNGLWYHASGTNNCAEALHWGAQLLWKNSELEKFDAAIQHILEQQALSHLPIFHPYLLGERAPLWRPDLCASLRGLQAGHGQPELACAIAEGVLHALKHARDVCQLSQENRPLVVTGGLSRLPGFMRLAASLLNQELTTLKHSDAGYGAALLAAVADGAMDMHSLPRLAISNRGRQYQPVAPLVTQLAPRHTAYLAQIPP